MSLEFLVYSARLLWLRRGITLLLGGGDKLHLLSFSPFFARALIFFPELLFDWEVWVTRLRLEAVVAVPCGMIQLCYLFWVESVLIFMERVSFGMSQMRLSIGGSARYVFGPLRLRLAT